MPEDHEHYEKKHLIIHLGIGDEEWFEVIEDHGIILMEESWLDKLCRMVPGYTDYVIVPVPVPAQTDDDV